MGMELGTRLAAGWHAAHSFVLAQALQVLVCGGAQDHPAGARLATWQASLRSLRSAHRCPSLQLLDSPTRAVCCPCLLGCRGAGLKRGAQLTSKKLPEWLPPADCGERFYVSPDDPRRGLAADPGGLGWVPGPGPG